MVPNDLPSPPPGRTGWPWTGEPPAFPNEAPGGYPWPRLSIVTPSYNQANFLEEAIRSVLLQGYPNLEYVVIDGGSNDGSRRIIETYSPWMKSWVSEPDRGQYDAINRGFERTSGDVMAWLNADDVYAPGALRTITSVFAQISQAEWVTSLRPIFLDSRGNETVPRRLPGFCRRAFMEAEYVVGVGHFASGWIPQESTFWRRSLWDATGGRVDDSLELAGDFELWTRFYERTDLYGIDEHVAAFRRHAEQKTALRLAVYVREASEVLERVGGTPSPWAWSLLRKCVTRSPSPVRSLGRVVGLTHAGKIIVDDGSGEHWRTATAAV